MLTRSFVICFIFSLLVNHSSGETSTLETLRTLSRYAAKDADTVFVVRHGLISSNSALQEQAENASEGLLGDAPFSFADVDHLIVLAPQPTEDSVGTFQTIANELAPQMPTELESEPADSRPSPFEGYAVFVRFTKPVTTDDFKTAIESQSEFHLLAGITTPNTDSEADAQETAYHKINWRDKEFLYTKNPNLPAILKIDEQSFVLCLFPQLRNGFASQTPDSYWFDTYSDDELAADLVILTDLDEQLVKQAAQGPMEPLSKAKRLFFAFDFDAPNLAVARVEFEDNTAAEDVISMVKGFHAMGKGMVTQQAEQIRNTSGNDKNTTWVSKQVEAIYDSVDFQLEDATAVVTVPRPSDFDELMMRVAKITEDHRTKEVARFEEIAKQLDTTTGEGEPIQIDGEPTDEPVKDETQEALKDLGFE